ncbi:hypothetical protein P4U97_05020 [Bacillus swezeyi]|uniref:hypothetical protein n=1 Tax=Bacillus swezeyi TaxID=1925020 RepID=UPI002E1C522E|nr:hypothetical protein [Bacillus swezeyi]
MEPRLQPVRKVLGWFEAEESLYNDCRFPAFFFEHGGPFYYRTPSLGGSGIKIGRHDGGLTTDPDMTNRSFGVYPSDEQDLQQFIQTYLPKGVGRFSKGGVCLYTKYPIHKREIIAIGQKPAKDTM